MNKICLSLIFILIALITASSACATTDVDNNIDVINQQDIADDISDITIDENVDTIEENTTESDITVENYTEVSNESSMNESIIEDGDNCIIVDDRELEDENNEIYSIESNSSNYLTNGFDDIIINISEEIVDNITKNAFIPDVDVQPINPNIEILGPIFNAAMYYYSYWIAYKAYFGIMFPNAITAIIALVHQSYNGYDTLKIVDAIFDMDPSITRIDEGSGKPPIIIR